MSTERYEFFKVIQDTLAQAARVVSLDPAVELMLSQPKNEIIVHFPVRMDDGTVKVFKGYRIQHNNLLGPYKGGIRYHETVGLDDLKALGVEPARALIVAALRAGKHVVTANKAVLAERGAEIFATAKEHGRAV